MRKLKILSTVNDLPEYWDSFVPHDTMLQKTYLKSLETASPPNIELYFILVYKNDSLVAISIVQHVKLYLQDIFRKDSGNKVIRYIRKFISSLLKGHILVAGNLTHTGQHGIHYDAEEISSEEVIKFIFKGLKEVSSMILKNQGSRIRLYLLKDYFLDDSLFADKPLINSNGLHRVKVQPNMILKVSPKWKSFDDYYSDLNKKYKRRYRRARKKFGKILLIELSEKEIEYRSKELTKLYKNVSNNAKLNMFILPEGHFYNYKKHLKDNFRLFGYFHKDQLIGFYSLIINNYSLETYFLGYDTKFQYRNQLYLNMLYDMLKFGIESGLNEIVYARTAMEIKSSVGAKPKAMEMYMKHTNSFLNYLLKPVFNLLDPTEEWEERHPFNQKS